MKRDAQKIGRYVAISALAVLCGCSSTVQLYVHNDTLSEYTLKVGRSSKAYPMAPDTKILLPERLERSTPYQLSAFDENGKKHSFTVYTDSPRLFIRLHESTAGQLEWLVSKRAPSH